MTAPHDKETAGTSGPDRLFVYNAGFLRSRLRRILGLAGWRLTTGRPTSRDHVGIWGNAASAARGRAVAERTGARLLRVEDAFLRSIRTGREGDPPLGLLIDPDGVHFDPAQPSQLEHLLQTHPLDDTALLDRARTAVDRLKAHHLSKYNAFDPECAPPPPGYVLVVDQTAEDASVLASSATRSTFREMLAVARIEHPAAQIYIKTHPETLAGHRVGHFGREHEADGTNILTDPVSPWVLLEGAVAVYTVSSQLGFEAILAGHRPRVFGQPFYAGWGLSTDERPVARRQRRITRAQLAAAALILAPTWYDPCRDRLCEIEDLLDHLEATTRAFREDKCGYVGLGMRQWKRGHLQRFFGEDRALTFTESPKKAVERAHAGQRSLLVWASAATPDLEKATAIQSIPMRRLEDGFLRSRGIGAALIPPLSLVSDDLGIYYDPSAESRLERMIIEAADRPSQHLRRAERLATHLRRHGVTKYNVDTHSMPDLPTGHRILVPGQVEDDGSILRGCTGHVRTNLGLLEEVRRCNPDAVLIYKPHPDVEAGLRPGAIPPEDTDRLADLVLSRINADYSLRDVASVWTMTSAIGFEALIRGLPVTCLGSPFYAGWGLTEDRAPTPARRRAARPSLDALVDAALIAYPRYRDPISGLPCSPEVIVERLASGRTGRRAPGLRILSRLQGHLASYAHLWR